MASTELVAGMLRRHGMGAAVTADGARGLELQLQGVRMLVVPDDAALAGSRRRR
jgi:hypothetical protein